MLSNSTPWTSEYLIAKSCWVSKVGGFMSPVLKGVLWDHFSVILSHNILIIPIQKVRSSSDSFNKMEFEMLIKPGCAQWTRRKQDNPIPHQKTASTLCTKWMRGSCGKKKFCCCRTAGCIPVHAQETGEFKFRCQSLSWHFLTCKCLTSRPENVSVELLSITWYYVCLEGFEWKDWQNELGHKTLM